MNKDTEAEGVIEEKLFYCVDCQKFKPRKDGQYVENIEDGQYIGQIWICNECIEES